MREIARQIAALSLTLLMSVAAFPLTFYGAPAPADTNLSKLVYVTGKPVTVFRMRPDGRLTRLPVKIMIADPQRHSGFVSSYIPAVALLKGGPLIPLTTHALTFVPGTKIVYAGSYMERDELQGAGADPFLDWTSVLDRFTRQANGNLIDEKPAVLAPLSEALRIAPSGTDFYAPYASFNGDRHEPVSINRYRISATPPTGAEPLRLISSSIVPGITYPDPDFFPAGISEVFLPASPPVIDPHGRHAYMPFYSQDVVALFDIDPGSGRMTLRQPAGVMSIPHCTRITLSPDGRTAYAVIYTDIDRRIGDVHGVADEVRQYHVNPDGILVALSPVRALISSGLDSVDVDPTGRYAYIARDPHRSEVFQFRVLPDGRLRPLSPPAVHAEHAQDISIDPSGKYAYTTDAYRGRGHGLPHRSHGCAREDCRLHRRHWTRARGHLLCGR